MGHRDYKGQEWEQRISASLQHGIEQGIFPGAICSLTVADFPPLIVARGSVSYETATDPVTPDTVYDLASLTKVVVTLPLILLSVQAGKISLRDAVADFWPGFAAKQPIKQQITLLHLLTHSSGLPAWRPYYLQGRGKEAYLNLIAAEELSAPPGRQVVYSDLGFMLLGFILEEVWQEPLNLLADQLLFEPLGMKQTAYNPLIAWQDRTMTIAPSEQGNQYEQGMIAGHSEYQTLQQQAKQFSWREQVICGTVHDGNAYYGLGGVSGHAGLFSTITDLQRYMTIWQGTREPQVLDPVLRELAVRVHTATFSSLMRTLGWEASATGGTLTQLGTGSSGGELISAKAFGHTGFTGTSMWHDPVRQATLITLTNRVHPTVKLEMVKWRQAHHNLVFAHLPPL